MVHLYKFNCMKSHDLSSINRQSVRQEAERIKAECDRLFANKKINDEARFLIKSMLMLINLLVSIFLEKSVNKNSKNSSKFNQ